MSERFFVHSPIEGDRANLTGDEARHLTSVMRGKVGDELVVFDGSGAEFTARVSAIHKHEVELIVTERRDVSRELATSLTLAVALPKGERQKWLVEKATELGITRLLPLITERGVAQPTESAVDRLRRGVIEASKQCGRNRLMEIATPTSAIECFQAAPLAALRLAADPTGQPLPVVERLTTQSMIVAIGPEGGFSPGELAAASAAEWSIVSLGARILRVETAALSVAAWAGLMSRTS